ncbi:MAG: 4Fe-4S binding protein [Planctomycetota bacterium]|nr:4Fe-4S binding protein [Planctomycetota bacterium]
MLFLLPSKCCFFCKLEKIYEAFTAGDSISEARSRSKKRLAKFAKLQLLGRPKAGFELDGFGNRGQHPRAGNRHGAAATSRASPLRTKTSQNARSARLRGSHQARLQYPEIDLQKCIGCGACVPACPEDGVLALAYGDKPLSCMVPRCVWHGSCADACPTGTLTLTLGDLKERTDLPALAENFEAVTKPGLCLAFEITGFALVRTAVQHGTSVAREVARCIQASERAPVSAAVAVEQRIMAFAGEGYGENSEPESAVQVLDLIIVFLGPAGLACALAAKAASRNFLALDQATEIGGTGAAYPRKKLIMTQPMHLPLHGKIEGQ